MKKYVECEVKFFDSTIIKFIYGNIRKNSDRRVVYIKDHEIQDGKVYDSVDGLFDNPIPTELSAKRLISKLKKDINTVDSVSLEFSIKEYPDEISYDQFKAFICW